MKITVVGSGFVGQTSAMRLLEKGLGEVVLIDIIEGKPQGLALDLKEAAPVEGYEPTIVGTNDYADTAGSEVVVVTAGLARKPGMSRDDLLAANSEIVGSVVRQAVAASPEAVVICVTNPLDIMTYLAWRRSGLAPERVFGMGGLLDSARFAYAIAEATGAPIESVRALACGAHGDAMVPLPRHSTVGGRPLTELLDAGQVAALVERTVSGGAEVVALLKTGSAFYAPAASVARMVAAVLSDSGETLPSCVRLTGQYGIDDVYLSVPATLGREGVRAIPELPLDAEEASALRDSAATIAASLDALGLRA
jgi:malate dehydrogenase